MQLHEQSDLPDNWKTKRDGELVRQYSEQKSQQAFAELTRRYANLVYTICLRETGKRETAEDAAQAVFLLLSRKAYSLKGCDTLSGWLYTASRYLAKNLTRQERRRQMTETAAMQEPVASSSSANPLWERIEPHFHDALDRLKPADRNAVLLRFVQEQSLADVGRHLGLSENTARMRVMRALDKIRDHLSKAGITVTVAALALLLEEHSAYAAPVSLVQRLSQPTSAPQSAAQNPVLSKAVRSAARWFFLSSCRKPLMILAGGLIWGGMAAGYHLMHPPRLTPTEQARLFVALQGRWQGTLEYADDRTHQRFLYPSEVDFTGNVPNSSLQWTATYQGTSSVDTTTLRGDPAGIVTVQNSGEQSSHRLAASGELFPLGEGGAMFQGVDTLTKRTVRIRFTVNANRVVIEEDYRSLGASVYQFRNRFTLKRR